MSKNDYSDQHSMPPWSELQQIKLGESIAMKTAEALRIIGWKDPNDISDINGELKEARATMLVNFGPEGKVKRGLINPNDRLSKMILDVFHHYNSLLKSSRRNV